MRGRALCTSLPTESASVAGPELSSTSPQRREGGGEHLRRVRHSTQSNDARDSCRPARGGPITSEQARASLACICRGIRLRTKQELTSFGRRHDQRRQTRSKPQERPPQPRSEDGPGPKARSSRNAVRHGLTRLAGLDPAFAQRIAELARLIAGPQVSGERFLIACRIACAQIDVMRARRARADLLSRGFYFFGQTNPKRSGGRKTMWPTNPSGRLGYASAKRTQRTRMLSANEPNFRKRSQSGNRSENNA
jgi:hypothetical protein